MSSQRRSLVTQSKCSGEVVQGSFVTHIKEPQAAIADGQGKDGGRRRAVKGQSQQGGDPKQSSAVAGTRPICGGPATGFLGMCVGCPECLLERESQPRQGVSTSYVGRPEL